MCCPLQRLPGNFVLTEVEAQSANSTTTFYLQGYIDFSPRTLSSRLLVTFQRLELAEKIAEIADETFHLFGSLLQRYANLMLYQTCRNLHHGAHDIEHFLHSFCFLGDLSRIWTGNFFEYRADAPHGLDYVRTLARVCHAVSHFFATLSFLSEHQLCRLGKLEPIIKYQAVLSTLGYGLWTTSLIWRHFKRQRNEQIASDLAIHMGGFFFEGMPIAKNFSLFVSYAPIINKISAIAGIVHAWSVASRLMPNTERVRGQFNLNQVVYVNETVDHHCPRGHGHSQAHAHSH